jgi:hypothetical protein
MGSGGSKIGKYLSKIEDRAKRYLPLNKESYSSFPVIAEKEACFLRLRINIIIRLL